ncbi:uncharacterized protein LOC116930034 [Daphnia magna]|uniref:uncharacterized protein LOC116930034 n=1 Tax=Daphnia magna TaxID=35525 RepID=UPI001E1BB851|nr:uncharacterized protein LOC116930034 [Daphnia magna]
MSHLSNGQCSQVHFRPVGSSLVVSVRWLPQEFMSGGVYLTAAFFLRVHLAVLSLWSLPNELVFARLLYYALCGGNVRWCWPCKVVHFLKVWVGFDLYLRGGVVMLQMLDVLRKVFEVLDGISFRLVTLPLRSVLGLGN